MDPEERLMCEGCWADYGSPRDVPEDADQIVAQFEDLYSRDHCSTGGPLHVVLDDWNLEDEHLGPWEDERDPWPPDVMELATKISTRLRELPIDQRAAVLALWEGWIS